MTVSHMDEKVLHTLEQRIVTLPTLAKVMGKGWTEQKAANTVLTLARKGKIDKVKAALILKDTPMIRFLNIPHNSSLK